MSKLVGITGGIGSGKSYVCRMLEERGYPVYYSDIRAKELTNSHPQIRKELIKLLGEEVYQNNQLNKKFLANHIFTNDSTRMKVNAIIHPIVRNDFKEWIDRQTAPFIFNEAAILMEIGSYESFDCMVVVTADLETRIERTMRRDGITREEVLGRISKQWRDEEKVKFADCVIYNDGRPLEPQLDELEAQLKKIQ